MRQQRTTHGDGGWRTVGLDKRTTGENDEQWTMNYGRRTTDSASDDDDGKEDGADGQRTDGDEGTDRQRTMMATTRRTRRDR